MIKLINRKGFTLIELLVIIAILGILVLLASFRFTSQVSQAKETRIRNDVRVAEDVIAEYLIDGNELEEDEFDINGPIDENKVYDRNGPVNDKIDEDVYDITDTDEIKSIKSKLPGDFVSDKDGNVYYVDDKSHGGNKDDENNDEDDLKSSIQVFARDDNTFYLLSNGDVWASGKNNHGMLGVGHDDNVSSITKVQNVNNVKQIAIGDRHTQFLTNDGEVYGVGAAYENGVSETTIFTPQKANIQNVEEIIGGHYHTIYIKSNGEIFGSGDGYAFGRDDLAAPEKISNENIKNIKNVVSNGYHTVYLTNDGEVWVVGENDYGQLGIGEEHGDYISEPIKLESMTDVKEVFISPFKGTFFLRNNGDVWFTGRGDYGLGGIDTRETGYIYKPEKVNVDNVINISTGSDNTFFVKSNGEVWASGGNWFGDLGLGDTNTRFIPEKVENIGPIQNVIQSYASGSGFATIFHGENDELWTTGANGIAFGDETNKPLKLDIDDIKIKDIAMGLQYAIFIDENDSIWALGYSRQGALGIENIDEVVVPTKNNHVFE